MFSHFVPPDSPMRAYWRRPLTFSGRGIDSIAQPYGVTSLESEKLESVEYKYKFALTELFNHPLTITKAIVAWEIDAPLPGMTVYDEYGWQGVVQPGALPDGIGYRVGNFVSKGGEEHNDTIEVIGLWELIRKTFKTQMMEPFPIVGAKKKGKK